MPEIDKIFHRLFNGLDDGDFKWNLLYTSPSTFITTTQKIVCMSSGLRTRPTPSRKGGARPMRFGRGLKTARSE